MEIRKSKVCEVCILYEKKLLKLTIFKPRYLKKNCGLNFTVLVLMEAECTTESENYNQNIFMYKICLLD